MRTLTEYVKTLRRCTCALSSFPWDTRPPSKIISLEIWASSLIRKNSLIVRKFRSLRTSASCSNLAIVPYFFPAPALKLLFQKKKSVLINSYKYIIIYLYIYTTHQLEFLPPFRWQTIWEQVQNYHSCQAHLSSRFSLVGSVNFRTRLERPLVHSMGDSEIFHVQLLKTLTKNDPGSQLR